MKYDPNYTYEDGDDAMAEEDEDYGDEEDYGGSDDDDTSWKVRNETARCERGVRHCQRFDGSRFVSYL